MKRAHIAAALAALLLTACASRGADDALVASAKRLSPSVVLVSMNVPGASHRSAPAIEYATGMVVASGAWGSDVLTVEHAVDAAWNLRMTIDNRTRVPARVVAKNSVADIALLRTARPNLPAVKLGSAAAAQRGRSVALLGYPIPDQFAEAGLGLATSLDAGRFSSVRRGALEVTLEIVPGESGSPVFLSDTGEIVGMAESRFEDAHSIGFALPIDAAKRFLHRHDAAHGL
jgi:S1-C subfamily serine protease